MSTPPARRVYKGGPGFMRGLSGGYTYMWPHEEERKDGNGEIDADKSCRGSLAVFRLVCGMLPPPSVQVSVGVLSTGCAF